MNKETSESGFSGDVKKDTHDFFIIPDFRTSSFFSEGNSLRNFIDNARFFSTNVASLFPLNQPVDAGGYPDITATIHIDGAQPPMEMGRVVAREIDSL